MENKQTQHDKDRLISLIKKLEDDKIKVLVTIVESMVNSSFPNEVMTKEEKSILDEAMVEYYKGEFSTVERTDELFE